MKTILPSTHRNAVTDPMQRAGVGKTTARNCCVLGVSAITNRVLEPMGARRVQRLTARMIATAQTSAHASVRADAIHRQSWANCLRERFFYMRLVLRRYRHLAALAVVLLFALVSIMLGVLDVSSALVVVGLFQLSQFAISKRCGVCFNAGLTPEQVKEFEVILKELSQYKGLFPDLLEQRPQLKKMLRQVPELQDQVDRLRRAGLSRGSSELRPGQLVTDDCAECLTAIAIVGAEKHGALNLLDASRRERLVSRSRSILGIEQRAALTSSDIPLPTEFSGQVVQLVNMYGTARRYGTVFPLGTGTTKLPRLKTDPTFGLIAASATVTEKSPQTEWVTFTAEKFGGLVRFPTELSEDSIVPLGNFIADYAARNIAMVEDTQFWISTGAGSGVNGSVKGLTESTITNSKVTQMASTKTKYSDSTLANFRDLRAVPDAAALRKGAYYLHPSFEKHLAGFNTAGDKPYNPQAQIQGTGAQPFITGPTLDGFPIRWIDILPAFSTSANPSKVFALFGDTSFQYLGVLGGIRFDTSTDAAFTTDEILIRALERLTIGLMAIGAVGGLQTAAS